MRGKKLALIDPAKSDHRPLQVKVSSGATALAFNLNFRTLIMPAVLMLQW